MTWTEIRDGAVDLLAGVDFRLQRADYDDVSFGNWVFDFRRGSTGKTLRLINDRGQILVDGSDPAAARVKAPLELLPPDDLLFRLETVLPLLREPA